MLSRHDVYPKLTEHFICLRLDWEQGYHFKDRFGFILGTGDQIMLDPQGQLIPAGQSGEEGKPNLIYGRHGRDTTGGVLQDIIDRFPKSDQASALRMEWFFWPRRESRRAGGFYPATPDAIAAFARLPQAIVHGPLPPALRDETFLHRHLRQFIWVRGDESAASQVVLRRVRDGLPKDWSLELAEIHPADLSQEAFGKALDDAWLQYMKNRPLVARGYLDNPHGKWMRSLREQMIFEDEEVLRRAREGALAPPGRSWE